MGVVSKSEDGGICCDEARLTCVSLFDLVCVCALLLFVSADGCPAESTRIAVICYDTI